MRRNSPSFTISRPSRDGGGRCRDLFAQRDHAPVHPGLEQLLLKTGDLEDVALREMLLSEGVGMTTKVATPL